MLLQMTINCGLFYDVFLILHQTSISFCNMSILLGGRTPVTTRSIAKIIWEEEKIVIAGETKTKMNSSDVVAISWVSSPSSGRQ